MRIYLFAFITALVLVAACGAADSPKEVTTHFFNALRNQRFKEAERYATSGSRELLDMLDKASRADSSFHQSVDTLPFSVTNIVIKGDAATAQVVQTGKSGGLTVPLKKESGEWKVDFDKNSVMMLMNDMQNP